jgi:hypothetical protein
VRGRSPPLSLEPCQKTPNRSFLLRGFWVKHRQDAAVAFPLLLVDEKKPTIHGDRITIFLTKIYPKAYLYNLRGI